MSPGNGTLTWTTFVEDLTTLETAEAKLMVEDAFVAEIERGVGFMTEAGIDDELAQVLHGEIDPSRDPRYAAVVRSVVVPGGFAKGVEAGIEIARRATELGGQPTTFLLATTGMYGGVAWVTGADSLAELERAEQAVNADPGFVQYIDEVAPGAFQPGVTTQAIYTRIA